MVGVKFIRKGFNMELALQIQELSSYLDDNKKRLILEIIKNFLPDDFAQDDLHYIELAEQEYARGETISHNDRNWK